MLTTIEKRSLLPRMIYLSMQSASGSVKENLEPNGTVVDSKLSVELKTLLERYAKILEFPYQDAIELLVGVSRDENPTVVCFLISIFPLLQFFCPSVPCN